MVGYDSEQAAITVRFADGSEENYDYLALDQITKAKDNREYP